MSPHDHSQPPHRTYCRHSATRPRGTPLDAVALAHAMNTGMVDRFVQGRITASQRRERFAGGRYELLDQWFCYGNLPGYQLLYGFRRAMALSGISVDDAERAMRFAWNAANNYDAQRTIDNMRRTIDNMQPAIHMPRFLPSNITF